MMGEFTSTLRQRLRADADVPDVIASMLRLGASNDFRGIAVPIEEHGAITGFEFWLASRGNGDSLFGLGRSILTLEERVGESFNVWQLRRMQQRITSMTNIDDGKKAAFGIWRVMHDFGVVRPSVVQTGPDLQLVRITWPSRDERWCSVAPINPQVRRTGL